MAAKKMMMGLVLFQIERHIFEAIATNPHADSKTRCISYKEVLPNGVCINELKNYKIFQSPLQAKRSNRNAQWVKVFLLLMENKTREQVLLYGTRILHEFFSRTRRSICHIMHPVCFKSEENGRIISSPPCRRLCTESDCENIIKTWIYNITLQMHKRCPNRIRDPRKHRDRYTCAQFPVADMKHVERCQSIIKRKEKHSEICYNGDGTSYNGTVNITSTGKACLPWNINPFLSSPVYSNLKNNYCRNPQGYATAPWCYVNATNRDWEFCDVPKCEGSKVKIKNINSISIAIKVLIVVSALVFTFVLIFSSWKIYRVWRKKKDVKIKNINSISIAIKVLIVVSALVFTFVLIFSSWKIYRVWRKKKDDTEYIEPYNVCDVSDKEKMSKLLRLQTRSGS
ncbi:uncharacterized protein LOC130636628 isoform X2 [Hydractinia symbiolongicarpus]|uniref:uncharacterized protein LOC130636628 isoform X2 n=1 Tax=Hydractinia symbiolongicarpus TaxID=13093 RepID=UPI00254CEFE9|nr:uncharacterized protein LOC130636628 isoform X2 [Hydractinia symbiolongicarpus]